MKTLRRTLVLVALATGWIACNSSGESKKMAPEASPVSSVPAAPAKPDFTLFMIGTDNLLLRDQPSKTGSKVISKFAQGDFVECTGKVSDKKEEALIHNIPMKEPYYEVISTTPEQHKGWAFGGALTPVYAGARASSPDLGKLSQLTTFLKPLSTKKLDSGKKAWDYVKTNFATANGPLADAAFVILEQFMTNLERDGEFYSMTEKIDYSDDDYKAMQDGSFDVSKYPETKALDASGFSIAMGEGSVFPVSSTAKFHAFFSSKVTPAMKAYLDQALLESKVQAWDDGGIIIPLEQLADRAAFWENFNKQYPYFILKARTQESQNWVSLALLNGENNTPTYDFNSMAIDENFKKVWAYILQKYPGTDLAKLAKQLNDLCAAEGWKRSEKVTALQMSFAEKFYPSEPTAQ